MLNYAISLACILVLGLLVGGAAMAFAEWTGIAPAHPTPIIQVVHTNTGCQL